MQYVCKCDTRVNQIMMYFPFGNSGENLNQSLKPLFYIHWRHL